jgi:hypothetical protein
MANFLSIIRIVALCLTLAFAVIVLGLAAHVTNVTEEFFGLYYQFAALAIATAVLTLVSLPVFLIVDAVRTGAITSMVVVELAWFCMHLNMSNNLFLMLFSGSLGVMALHWS